VGLTSPAKQGCYRGDSIGFSNDKVFQAGIPSSPGICAMIFHGFFCMPANMRLVDMIHLGVFRPGDDTHSRTWEAVSAWRAFLNRSSRGMPAGISSACLRKF
jgi:hypothetical protein